MAILCGRRALPCQARRRPIFSFPSGKAIPPPLRGDQRRRLAFSSDRGTHAFIGLYVPGRASLVWVAPSVDTDAMPCWSPAGAALGWVRYMAPRNDGSYSALDGAHGNRGPDMAIMAAPFNLTAAAGGRNDRSLVGEARTLFLDRKYGAASFGYGSRPSPSRTTAAA